MPARNSPVQRACSSLLIFKFTQASFRVPVNQFPFSNELIKSTMPAQAANASAEGQARSTGNRIGTCTALAIFLLLDAGMRPEVPVQQLVASSLIRWMPSATEAALLAMSCPAALGCANGGVLQHHHLLATDDDRPFQAKGTVGSLHRHPETSKQWLRRWRLREQCFPLSRTRRHEHRTESP